MYGADADELERIAGEFRRSADELDAEGTTLTGVLNRVAWLGDVATRYRDHWTGVQVPKIALSTEFLREAASRLEANAQDQRATSGSDGGTGPGADTDGNGRPDWMDRPNQGPAYEGSEALELRSQLDDMMGADAAAQAAWWNGLTDEQRSALISSSPVALLAMGVLSTADRKRAQDSYQSEIAPEIVTGTAAVAGSIEVEIAWFNAEAGFDLTKTDYEDGHVEVTFGADVGAGANVKAAEAMAELGVAGTYSFANEADYQAFLEGMYTEINDPNLADTHIEIASYLVQNADHLKSTEVSLGVSVSGEAEVPGVYKLEGEVGAGVAVQTNVQEGSTTVSASAHANASANFESLGINGARSGDVEGSVTFKDGQPQQLTVSIGYDGAQGYNLPGNKPFGGQATGTMSGTATMSFDLTDPAVRAEMGTVVDSMQRGDMGSVVSGVAGLGDQSSVVIQEFAGAKDSYGFDAKVVKGSISVDADMAVSTYVKPPGSEFFKVD